MKKLPQTDREKAFEILRLATSEAPGKIAALLAGDDLDTQLDVACLAHAYDDGLSKNFAHEVLHFRETRAVMQRIASERVAAQVAGGGEEQPGSEEAA